MRWCGFCDIYFTGFQKYFCMLHMLKLFCLSKIWPFSFKNAHYYKKKMPLKGFSLFESGYSFLTVDHISWFISFLNMDKLISLSCFYKHFLLLDNNNKFISEFKLEWECLSMLYIPITINALFWKSPFRNSCILMTFLFYLFESVSLKFKLFDCCIYFFFFLRITLGRCPEILIKESVFVSRLPSRLGH